MNLSFPHALLMWARENKKAIFGTRPPSDMPPELREQLEEVKLRLEHYERDFRGAQDLLARDSVPPGWHVSTGNLAVRAASAALRCVERAMPLITHLRGPVWGALYDFLWMPAPFVRGCAAYTLLKDGTLDEAMKDAHDVRLHWEYSGFELTAGRPAMAGARLSVPEFSSKGASTVQDELEYLLSCRRFVRENLEHMRAEVVREAERLDEFRKRGQKEAQEAQARREVDVARVEELAGRIHACLSEEDRQLLLAHTDILRDIFAKQ